MSKKKRFRVVFDDDLIQGHTFQVDYQTIHWLSDREYFEFIMRQLAIAGVQLIAEDVEE